MKRSSAAQAAGGAHFFCFRNRCDVWPGNAGKVQRHALANPQISGYVAGTAIREVIVPWMLVVAREGYARIVARDATTQNVARNATMKPKLCFY